VAAANVSRPPVDTPAPPAEDAEPPRPVKPAPRAPAVPKVELPKVEPAEPEAPRAAGGQLSTRALHDLKGATVFIKVEAGKGLSCSGSGFLVKAEGDTGYVVTNHHVINPEAELLQTTRSRSGNTTRRVVKYKPKNATVTAVFNSGTKDELSLSAEVVTADASCDLAVLRVTGRGDWPRPIVLEHKANIVETMPVYILGFPFGEALAFKQGNPAITINKGSVSSLRENEFGQIKAVQIDGALNPGNSGGPVVDADGRLVGISVATIKGTGIGLAIAPEELKRLFEGRVGAFGPRER
jgi:S1-C subfamily serine protease